MNAEHFSADIREILRLLHLHGVRYLLVGGEAVIYHGYARLTGDVDLFYEATPENATRLFAALVEFWGGSVPGVAAAAELCEPNVVVQFGRPPNRIDFLNAVSGIDFADAWRTRIQEQMGEVPVAVIGLEALIRNKVAADRDKDRDDLSYLRRKLKS